MQSKITYYVRRSIFDTRFIVCALSITLICFTTIVYIDYDSGKGYSVFETMVSLGHLNEFQLQELTFINVFSKGLMGDITLILPILAAFPCVSFLSEERNTSMTYFSYSRRKRMTVWISQYTSCVLSAFCVVMIGYAMFGVIIGFSFPLGKVTITNAILLLIRQILLAGVYGSITSLPILVCFSIMRNEYIYYSISLAMVYTMDVLSGYLQERIGSYMPNEMDFNFIKPKTMLEYYSLTEPVKVAVIVMYMIVAIVSLFLFIFINNRRVDYGN